MFIEKRKIMRNKYYLLISNYQLTVESVEKIRYYEMPVKDVIIWYLLDLGTDCERLVLRSTPTYHLDYDIGLLDKNGHFSSLDLNKNQQDKFLSLYKQLYAAYFVSYSSQRGFYFSKKSFKLQEILEEMSQLIRVNLKLRGDSCITSLSSANTVTSLRINDKNNNFVAKAFVKDFLKQNQLAFGTKTNNSVKVHNTDFVEFGGNKC